MTSNRCLIIHVQCDFLFSIYNENDKTVQLSNLTPKFENNILFSQIESFVNLAQVKAIACTMHGCEFQTFVEMYEFRLKFYEFCQKHGAFCYFPSMFYIDAYAAILQSKIIPKDGEKVVIIFLGRPGPAETNKSGPTINVLLRKDSCYNIVNYGVSALPPFTALWKFDILGAETDTKIILFDFEQTGHSEEFKKAEALFKGYPSTISINQKNDVSHFIEPIVAKIQFFMDKKVTPYDVANTCLGEYEVRVYGRPMIAANFKKTAPFEESVVVKVNHTKRISLHGKFLPTSRFELLKDFKMSTFKCKKVKVTLKLDINSFYDFKIEPFDEKKMNEKMSKMNFGDKSGDEKESNKSGADKDAINTTADEKPFVPEKARMIFDKQNFSVSCFADDKEYILNDSNGSNKTPIYISFTEKKPIIGKVAQDMIGEKSKFVVFDLIKLCTISNADIFNPKWGFTVFQDDNIIGVTVETVDGERKYSAAFLMALILKNGKDRIKKEYGKRMEVLEIGFNGFAPNEILKNNFVEAGNLLKINIVFV